MTDDLCKYLAVGKLARAPDGSFKPDKHQILCSQGSTSTPESRVKAFKVHIKAIMTKGASKLQSGKRIRLTSDENDYDLHVLADALNDDPKMMFVFFAVTVSDFTKYHPIAQLLKQFKQGFYECFHLDESSAGSNKDDDSAAIQAQNELTTTGSSMNRLASPLLSRLLSQYGTSQLAEVQLKVDAVRDIMHTNVTKALDSVEQLEDMEVKSEHFEEQARSFNRNAGKVKSLMRSKYLRICCLVGILVIVLLSYIIYEIAS